MLKKEPIRSENFASFKGKSFGSFEENLRLIAEQCEDEEVPPNLARGYLVGNSDNEDDPATEFIEQIEELSEAEDGNDTSESFIKDQLPKDRLFSCNIMTKSGVFG